MIWFNESLLLVASNFDFRDPLFSTLPIKGLLCSLNFSHLLQDVSSFPPFQPGWLNKVEDEFRTALWDQSGKAWQSLLDEISDESRSGDVVVTVCHPAIHIGLMAHCLNLTEEWLGSFHLDAGSVSVLDFPDGPKGRGVIRCINYTAHLGRWSIPITRPTEDAEEF